MNISQLIQLLNKIIYDFPLICYDYLPLILVVTGLNMMKTTAKYASVKNNRFYGKVDVASENLLFLKYLSKLVIPAFILLASYFYSFKYLLS